MREKINQHKWLRYVILAVAVLIMIVGVVELVKFIAPNLYQAMRDGNTNELEYYIKGAGIKGIILLFFIEIFEMILFVIPGAPVRIVAGAIYGTVLGGFICWLGFITANFLMFSVIHKFGVNAVEETAGIKTNPKVRQLIEKAKNPTVAIMIICLIPFVPNGVLPYVAASTGLIDRKDYIFAIALGSFPAIFIYAAIGKLLVSGDLKQMILVFAAIIAVSAAIFFNRKKLMAWLERVIR